MTTLYPTQLTCAVCGFTTEYVEMRSTSSFGYPDLDTRPSELARSTIGFWIQRCYRCGYCASDVSKVPAAGVTDILLDDAYLAVLNNDAYPATANHFLARAFIDEKLGDSSAAGWSAVRAAWICDDQKKDAAAIACREQAVELFRRAAAEGREFAPAGTDSCVLADLLRRSRRFREAADECRVGLTRAPDEQIRSILGLQLKLIAQEDVDTHHIGEALDR